MSGWSTWRASPPFAQDRQLRAIVAGAPWGGEWVARGPPARGIVIA
jgi:hypothetical protein